MAVPLVISVHSSSRRTCHSGTPGSPTPSYPTRTRTRKERHGISLVSTRIAAHKSYNQKPPLRPLLARNLIIRLQLIRQLLRHGILPVPEPRDIRAGLPGLKRPGKGRDGRQPILAERELSLAVLAHEVVPDMVRSLRRQGWSGLLALSQRGGPSNPRIKTNRVAGRAWTASDRLFQGTQL